jgi:hypothetical protein
MKHMDNPAGRLHALLLQLKERSDNFSKALCEIYQVSYTDALKAAPVISRVVQLPDRAKAQVLSLDDSLYDSELILNWHQPVRTLLSRHAFNSSSAGSTVVGTLDNSILLSLQFCSDLLHRHLPEYVPQDEELQRIIGLIRELRDEISDPALDPELRAFLLRHANDMEAAIVAFPIDGSTALADALDKAVGSLNRRSDIVVKAEKAPSAWAKFGNIIVVVAAVCQITGAQLALPSLIKQELASGPEGHTAQVVIQSGGATAQHRVSHADVRKER